MVSNIYSYLMFHANNDNMTTTDEHTHMHKGSTSMNERENPNEQVRTQTAAHGHAQVRENRKGCRNEATNEGVSEWGGDGCRHERRCMDE